MATPTRVKVDKLLRYSSVDRKIRRENPNYKTIIIRVKREQASFVLRRENGDVWCRKYQFCIQDTARGHPVAVEVMF